jgi:hypothetical protein
MQYSPEARSSRMLNDMEIYGEKSLPYIGQAIVHDFGCHKSEDVKKTVELLKQKMDGAAETEKLPFELAYKNLFNNPEDGFKLYQHGTEKKSWDLGKDFNRLGELFNNTNMKYEVTHDDIAAAKGEKVPGTRRTNTELDRPDPLDILERPVGQEQQPGQILTHVSDSLLPHQQRQAADYSHIPLLPLKTPDGITTNYRPIQPGETLRPNEQIYNLQTNKGPVDCIVESQVDAYGRVTYKRQ